MANEYVLDGSGVNIVMSNEFSPPIVAFESYNYDINDDSKKVEFDEGVTEFELTELVCKIQGLYEQEQGDEEKCYQFFLYNSKYDDEKKEYQANDLIGGTKQIYSGSTPYFVCENLNNNQIYFLKFKCISQSGNEVYSNYLKITTNYNKNLVYTNIGFQLDKSTAENIVYVDLVDLTGVSDIENLTYYNKDEVDLTQHYVTFTDNYNLINNNFLCRLWLRNIQNDNDIFVLTNTNSMLSEGEYAEYIAVKFYDNRFHAFKHSCGLVSHYVSDKLEISDNENNKLYFSLGYYNGRIEMYAEVLG